MNYRIMLNQNEIWNMTKTHRHDCLEILLCLNGGGSFFLQDKVFPLQKGTLIVTQENVLHRSIATENGYERYVLYVPKETLLSASGKKTDFPALFNESFCLQTNSEIFFELKSLFEKC